MQCTELAKPFHRDDWIYEEKIDGWDLTRRFPEIAAAALTKLKPKTCILDGEVAVFDENLVFRFESLRHLNHGDLATHRCSWCLIFSSSGTRTTGKSL